MTPADSTRWTKNHFQKIIHFHHLYLNRTFTKTSFSTNKINYTSTSFSLPFSPSSAVESFSSCFLRTCWDWRKSMACKNQLNFFWCHSFENWLKPSNPLIQLFTDLINQISFPFFQKRYNIYLCVKSSLHLKDTMLISRELHKVRSWSIQWHRITVFGT